MNQIIIIEDELLNASRLKHLLLHINPSWDIIGPLRSIEETISYLQSHHDYSLIFADISLLDGVVFDAFKVIKPEAPIIYTTAYDEYALQAIKNYGLDYLLKPIDPKELQEALHKLEVYSSITQHEQLTKVTPYKERVLAYKGEYIHSISVSEILFFYVNGKLLHAVDINGNTYHLPMSMHDIELTMNPKYFFRVNRQYLVHIQALEKIAPYFNSKLSIRLKHCSDENIHISKERVIKFKEWLNQ